MTHQTTSHPRARTASARAVAVLAAGFLCAVAIVIVHNALTSSDPALRALAAQRTAFQHRFETGRGTTRVPRLARWHAVRPKRLRPAVVPAATRVVTVAAAPAAVAAPGAAAAPTSFGDDQGEAHDD